MEKSHKYPQSLVPYKGLKSEIQVDEILSQCGDFGVARRVGNDIEKYIKDLGDGLYVLSLAYQEEHRKDPIDMSMNILTKGSGIEEVKFLQTKKPACENWAGTNVDIMTCLDSLKYDSESHCLVYCASKLHNKPGIYTRKYNDRNSFNIDKAITLIDEEFSSSTEYQRSFKIRLHHKPTNCNYWHIVLDIIAPSNGVNGKVIRDKKWVNESPLLDYIWSKYLAQGFRLDENPCKPVDVRISFDHNTHSWIRMFNSYKTKWIVSRMKVPEKT